MSKALVALVGTKFRGANMVALLASLPNGEPLVLKREPDNEHDRGAVQVWARGQHIGYVKGTQNRQLAARMDSAAERAGVQIRSIETPAKLAIDGGKQPMVEIEE